MDKNEKEIFCSILKKVKVPDGYAANISRCVQLKPPKIFGLKSHDNHILMQQLLSLALRKVLPKHVRYPLMNLCRYYRQLCSKVLRSQDLTGLENMIAKTLCDLERIFPPSFFDVMVHLSVHLASEAKIVGPVHYRWMYPVERYLSTLKSYVRTGSENQIVCSTCRYLLFYPTGATSVFCVVCNSVTIVLPTSDDGTPHKRVRRPTFMPSIWARQEGDRIHVLFNEYGQPIDKETTSSLSHFMGSLARSGKFCPVDKAWHQVKKAKKEILLEFIKENFDLSPGSEDWLLKLFGKKVRNWRARIKEGFYDPSLPLQELKNAKPKRVRGDQWENLIKDGNKEESKKMSEINKKNRKNKKMMQVTGKKSYARVREELKESSSGREPSRMDLFVACFSKDGTTKNVEAANAIKQMQELHSQLPEGSVDELGTEDIFSKVMGKDKDGRARMYGLGVRASDVWGIVSSRPACYRETMQWKAAYEGISSELAEVKAMVLEMRGSNQNASCASSVPVTSTHRPKVATKHPTLQVGFEVYLKSIINTMEIVAKARVKSLDPDELVGGEELGPNWCEAHVLVAIKKRERLVRPYGLFVTIEDAIGATIAWPCPFISVVSEDET